MPDARQLDFGAYEKKGLYLHLKDGTRLELTDENIEKTTQKFWSDPALLSPETKSAVEIQRCPACPLRNEEDFCDALRPILPFLEVVDKFVSFDEVLAVYKGKRKDLLRISQTTMQNALKYLSILSLTHYCQSFAKFRKYFYGITPLMTLKESVTCIYLNLYWLYRGDLKAMNELLTDFKEKLTLISQNQVKRLSVISRNDAFINAFVKTQLLTEFISVDMEQALTDAYQNTEST